MFRPLLVIFRFLIRKKYILEDYLYKVLSNIYLIYIYQKMIKTTCFGHYLSSSGFHPKRMLEECLYKVLYKQSSNIHFFRMRNLKMTNSGRNMQFLSSSNKHLLDIHCWDLMSALASARARYVHTHRHVRTHTHTHKTFINSSHRSR